MSYVINLTDVNNKSINEVGGKGANLGEMIRSGFPVPQGFCVTSFAYGAYMHENNFETVIEKVLPEIYERPAEANGLAIKLQSVLASGTLPNGMEEEIKAAYTSMANVRVAVRSSATAEDLPEASFAGQQDTYLNIQGTDSLILHIKKCFASLWTERAIMYRKKTGYDKEKISLSVTVQEMIESDVSGVMFTLNPVGNNMKEVMINASYGLGESIVSGLVTPDTYIWNIESKTVTSKKLGSKEIAIVYSEKGTMQINNSINKRKTHSLSESQIKELAQIGKKIEAHYGSPQDIEWALRNGEMFILQSRAITTLKDNSSPALKTGKKQTRMERMLMNNMLEHSPEPLYPLDVFAICDVNNMKARAMAELGVKMKGTLLTVNEDGSLDFHIPSIRVSPKLPLAIFKIKGYGDYQQNTAATEKSLRSIQNKLDIITGEDISAKSTSQLLDEIDCILQMATEINWIRFRYNIFPNVLLNKRINAALKNAKLDFNEYDLLSGLSYKTWEMNVDLSSLVALIYSFPDLKGRLDKLDGNAKAELNTLFSEFPAVYKAFCHFMEKYGWKSTCTYRAFSASSWHEDISTLIALLKSTTSTSKQLPDKFNHLLESINDAFSERKAQRVMAWIKEIRRYHVYRELTLYMLEQCYGLCRIRAKKITQQRNDVFSSYEDILRLSSVELLHLEKASVEEIKGIIQKRQLSQVKNRKLWDSMEVEATQNSKHELKGISGNTGKVKGRVCIIQGTSDFVKLKSDDILVCKYTDPVWTPLFTIAKAVVSDTGGPLSHSAIVAREYNIPAVLGCGNATQLLSDGQEIIVDGNNGIVNIL